MIGIILLTLIILWLLGYLQVPAFGSGVISLGNTAITLGDILIFLVVVWLVGILPTPFREIAAVMFLIWVLASVGIISLAGFSNVMLLAIIVGLIVYLVSFARV